MYAVVCRKITALRTCDSPRYQEARSERESRNRSGGKIFTRSYTYRHQHGSTRSV